MNKIHISVVMLLNPDNDLLLVRKKGSRFFQLPGGKVDVGESLVQAAMREVEEELGIWLNEKELYFLGFHEAKAVNEEDTFVRGDMFRYKLKEFQTFDPRAEIEEVVWVNYNNYEMYQWANLIKEYIQPLWLAEKDLRR